MLVLCGLVRMLLVLADRFRGPKSCVLFALQDVERDDFRAAGYRKLQQLKLLKAAAARLISQQDGQQVPSSQLGSQLSWSSSSFSSMQASQVPLVRSFSNIEHVMPSQRMSSLSRSSSTDRPGPAAAALNARADLPPLVRSNSAGANRMAAYVPSPQVVVQQTSAQQRPAGYGHSSSWSRAPRYSEPVGGMAPDDRLELLLTEVSRVQNLQAVGSIVCNSQSPRC